MNEPIIDKRRPIQSKRKFRERRAGKEMEFEGRSIDLDWILKWFGKMCDFRRGRYRIAEV
jgi:hypothetical protein